MDSRASTHRPRFHLVTLGRLTLLGPDGVEDASLGTRRRKLAVLAYLALRGRPSTRDHLAALFWGGKEDERARNSLSDVLSHVRRVLGRDALVTRGDEVNLAADAALTVDALELRAAVAARDWARATSCYRGPFLDSVYVDDAPDFEQWHTTEGECLRRHFAHACARHAPALAEGGEWAACADLSARWLDAEPASAEAALCRLKALSAPRSGEALAAALVEYERLRARLAEELGVGVDARVEQLAVSIRAELPPVAPPIASPSLHATVDVPALAAPVEPARATERPAAIARAWPRRAIGALAAVVAVLVLLVGAASRGARPPITAAPPTLVVLPFVNVGAAGDAYFADGLADEVRARLTSVKGLRVIGGTSARQYRGSTKSPREIARELGATYLLVGTVRWERSATGRGRVRVSPELVRAADEANVWAESVDGSLDEVFGMQSRVAERVASALDLTLVARERRAMAARPTTNLAAYDAFLRGRARVSTATKFSAVDRQATLREFERAVTLDSTFAAAHAAIAWVHFEDYSQAGDPASAAAALARFRTSARRAWALDTTLVETRLVHARDLQLDGDAAGAERLVRETARAMPGDVKVLGALGGIESRAGHDEAAIAAYREAMALDPRAAGAWQDLAGHLDRRYRHEEAIAVRERELEVTPDADVGYAVQAASHLLWHGDTAAARRTLERGSVALPWVVRFPDGVAGIAIWKHVLPPAVLRARDTLTLAGYLAGPGGLAPELYHLVELRHLQWSGRANSASAAHAHADAIVARLEPALHASGDAPWFFWWFSRRSVLAEAYATLGRNADAARETDASVAEARLPRAADASGRSERLCHALHNGAYVDALVGRRDVAVARLTEALGLPCGHRVSRALLRVDEAWAPLRGYPAFERLVAGGP